MTDISTSVCSMKRIMFNGQIIKSPTCCILFLSIRPSNTPPCASAAPPFGTSTSTPPSSSSTSTTTQNVASPAALEPVESSRPEVVLRWHFCQLDVDSSGVLSEREARPLRQFLRRKLKPRRCAKKFAQYCDRDGDRGLTLEELRVCLGP